jgi:3,4-dihydroxy 2-butanone 4-phosphate synthase / GTP cyclohydrolase II
MNAALKPIPISPVEDIVAELRAGRMVILVDEEDRENEGDLVLAADHVSPEAINFMARFGRGLICLTLTRERCQFLGLPPMTMRNGTSHGTAFTVSIEAAEGVSPPAFQRPTGRAPFKSRWPRTAAPKTWCNPVMCFPCKRWMAAC